MAHRPINQPMANLPTQIVDTPRGVASLCDHLEEAGAFGFDTEFVSEETYMPILCLVQVATTDRLAIIDPLAVEDLSRFWDLVAGSQGGVTAHAAQAEIRFARYFADQEPGPMFDVQIAAGLLGYGFPLSYTNLVRHVLGEELRGSETRSEWRRRPLTDRQFEYAIEDVRHLLELRSKLAAQLDKAGRLWWLEEECRAQVAEPEESNTRETWRRMSGTMSMNRRQLAVLRELVAWRLSEADARDRPVRSVAQDALLVEIAKRQPTDVNDLNVSRGMNRSSLRRDAEQIVEAVRRALALPERDCPSPAVRIYDPEGVTMLAGVLGTALSALSAQESVTPSLIASSAELTNVARAYAKTGKIPEDSPIAKGWRQQLCGWLFAELLEGKLCLRVGDPKADMPLVIGP